MYRTFLQYWKEFVKATEAIKTSLRDCQWLIQPQYGHTEVTYILEQNDRIKGKTENANLMLKSVNFRLI